MANVNPHTQSECTHPNFLLKCRKCLVYSLDGSGHTSPCRPNGEIVRFRTDIYAEEPSTVFKMRFAMGGDEVYYLNYGTQRFETIIGKELHAHEVDGVFLARKIDEKDVIEFHATSLNRFSVAIAFFSEGEWRLRGRILITLDDGILCFPLFRTLEKEVGNDNDTYKIPSHFEKNTVLILGVKTADESIINIRAFANQTGLVSSASDGYLGKITWNRFLDKIKISDSMSARHQGNNYRFEMKLYKPVGCLQAEHTPSIAEEVG